MKWLAEIIDAALPELTGGRRDDIVQLILESIPAQQMVEWIAGATAAVLKQRGVCDAGGDLSHEIGRNAAQTVLLMLHVDGLEEVAAKTPAVGSQP